MLFSYIDPFTGSVVLQVLAAGFLGIVAFFRPIWYFITGKKVSKTEKALDDWDETAEGAENAENAAAPESAASEAQDTENLQ